MASRRNIANGALVGKQLIFELLITALEWTAVVAAAGPAELSVAEPLQIAFVKEIGLVAETAGHPLPTQMVAGGVSIEKMLQKPVCSCFPVHLPPMHHVSRQPRVVSSF